MRKLIEVALPLEAINRESLEERFSFHGHPSTLHLWWARRPLASARAVLFASLVDDPGEYLPEEEAKAERQRLFGLLERLVNWDSVKDPEEAEKDNGVIGEARYEIAKSLARAWGRSPPPLPGTRSGSKPSWKRPPRSWTPSLEGAPFPSRPSAWD